MTGGGRRELKPGGCVHFWDVLPPTHPESAAVCRFCGEGRVFSNREVNEGRPSWRYGLKLRRDMNDNIMGGSIATGLCE
jgi:hypothetical protein